MSKDPIRGRNWNRRLGFALTAALALSAFAYALNAGAVTRNSSIVLAGNSSGGTTVRCLARERVTGMGFETQTDQATGVVITSLVPAPRKVRGTAISLANNGGYVDVTAECGKRPRRRALRRTKIVRKSVTVAGGTEEVVIARCPRGLSVRAGGWKGAFVAAPGGPGIVVADLFRPAPRNLRVRGVNGGAAEGTLTAIALCGKGPALRPRAASTTRTDGAQEASALARCPAGRVPGFGGFKTSSAPGDTVYPRDMHRVGVRSLRIGSFSFAPNQKLTAIAYCRRR